MSAPRPLNRETLPEAEKFVRDGGIIVIPTDTVYGIGCAFDNRAAIERIFALKRRDPAKSIAVLLSDADQAGRLAGFFPPAAKKLADEFWPGGLTLVVLKKNGLPENLAAGPTIGLRIPDHDLVRALIRRTGPLAATSVNFSGFPAALSAGEVPSDWFGKIAAVYDGGPIRGGKPSTVVDCTGEPLRILREGALTARTLGLK